MCKIIKLHAQKHISSFFLIMPRFTWFLRHYLKGSEVLFSFLLYPFVEVLWGASVIWVFGNRDILPPFFLTWMAPLMSGWHGCLHGFRVTCIQTFWLLVFYCFSWHGSSWKARLLIKVLARNQFFVMHIHCQILFFLSVHYFRSNQKIISRFIISGSL